jgi:hypothetical protein
LELFIGLMEENIWVNGKMGSSMVKAHLLHKTVSNVMANGIWGNESVG